MLDLIDTSQSGPVMVSIGHEELSKCIFEIPEYQRGFRWTSQQIKELIDDLYGFSRDRSKTYCLQNITVRRKNDDTGKYVYEVIDGQQRLTAIWILFMAFMDSRKYEHESLPVYTLRFIGKEELTSYVKRVTEKVCNATSGENRGQILRVSPGKDVDSAFIKSAFDYIINKYKTINDTSYDSALLKIFSDDFFSKDKESYKEISFIWNEIKPVGNSDEEKTKYVIERFSNLNANKIPLTESELIKAYFINRIEKSKEQEFSLQWEEMERRFNNDDFWCFISSGENMETRLDLLFQIKLKLSEGEDRNGQHILSSEINNLMNSSSAYEIWKDIVQIYETLNDWYNDYYYYHMIGLIIAIEDKQASTLIKELYNKYREQNKSKFKETLRKRLRCQNQFNQLFMSSKETQDWEIHQAEDICFDGEVEVSYLRDKKLVRNMLLLFNISLLLNAYLVNPENAVERFSFKIYKDKRNPIEIEHINPQHLEGNNDNRRPYTLDEKKKWAEETCGIIEDEEEQNKIMGEIKKEGFDPSSGSFIERIEKAARLNDLSNLTLLDKKLNSSYGDKFFIDKRNHILAARFGNPIFDDNHPERNHERRYTQSVIFPGTMWVFMRQYALNDNKATTIESPKNEDRWNDRDRCKYIEYMKKSIYNLLKDENN